MAATIWQPINIRDAVSLGVPGLTGETFYHGTVALVNADGYAVNATTSLQGTDAYKFAGIVYTDSTSALAASGVMDTNSNIINIYNEGYIDSIPFDAITIIDIGKVVYVKDNWTLTTDPGSALCPIGIITKYYSATKAEVKLFGCPPDNSCSIWFNIDGGSTDTTIISLLNPFGETVLVKNAIVAVETAASSAVSGDMGIQTSAATGDNLVDGNITFGTAGYFSAEGTPGTNGAPYRAWNSTSYVTLFSTDVVGAALRGYARVDVEFIV